MKKWIVILLVLAAGGFWFYKQRPNLAAKPENGVESRPKTAVVEERDINFSVPAAGEISPAEQVSVKPEINGRIEQLPVDIGDEVKKGDLLFSLDDKELRNEKASRETEIARAKLQLDQAERNFKRAGELAEENLISKELYENSKTEYELAKNAVERSQREIAIIDERLTKTKILAPFNCTILTRPVSMGQAVSGSGGFNSGTEVLTIADLNNLVINAHINQADITRLRQDQQVDVAVEAVSGLNVVGTVERIAPQATIRNNIKGFAVRILLKDVDKRIRPGMTANIKIPVASAENVVSVPLAAVFSERDPQTFATERYVYVKNGESNERRPVKIGVADFFYAEVQAGLEAGEIVSLEPPKDVADALPKLANKSAPGGEQRGSQPATGTGGGQRGGASGGGTSGGGGATTKSNTSRS
ncbi:MAG TPA: efflux RND transporter periplasmic adaptor subunit [Verrucomicrobiae bacterium]